MNKRSGFNRIGVPGSTPCLLAAMLLCLASCERPPAAQPPGSPAGNPATPAGDVPGVPARPAPTILVFSRTAGFRHDSIPAGITAIQALGQSRGFTVEATEDPGTFSDESLARFDAVVFLSTTGDVLDEAQQAAFERYIAAGHGYAGIHAAADTEYDWPWYGRLVGAYFKGHPAVQDALVVVGDRAHESTAGLPEQWRRRDEWYDYRNSPRDQVDGATIRILATLDEASYEGGTMGADHPIAWCHEYGGGRAWYTGGGHTPESYAEPEFLDHLAGGILWACGR